MATLQAVTTSAPVPITDRQAIEELLEQYEFSVTAEVTDEGRISIFGRGMFTVWDNDPLDASSQACQREFLYRLAQYLPEQAELTIQVAGYEKCRYPVHAVEWVVRPGLVLHATLGEPRCPVTPPASLAEIESFEPDSLAGPLAPGTDIDEEVTPTSFDYESPGPFHTWDTATIRDVRDVLQLLMDRISDPTKLARLQWVFEALGSELPPVEGVQVVAQYQLGYGRHETADLELTRDRARKQIQQDIWSDALDPEITVRIDSGVEDIDSEPRQCEANQ